MVRVERRGRARERGEDERGETKQGREERRGKRKRREEETPRPIRSRGRGGRLPRHDPSRGIPYLWLPFPLQITPQRFCGTAYLLVTVQSLSFPDQDNNFHGLWLKNYDDMSECLHTAPHSCAACTGNSNTTSFPVNRRYTDENESSLYSNDVESLASKNLEIVPTIKRG